MKTQDVTTFGSLTVFLGSGDPNHVYGLPVNWYPRWQFYGLARGGCQFLVVDGDYNDSLECPF